MKGFNSRSAFTMFDSDQSYDIYDGDPQPYLSSTTSSTRINLRNESKSKSKVTRMGKRRPASSRPTTRNNVWGDKKYSAMISAAILSSERKKLALAGIYDWFQGIMSKIRGRDPKDPGWKNSVRHNLSLYDFFEKIPTPGGQGFEWTVIEDKVEIILWPDIQELIRKTNGIRAGLPVDSQLGVSTTQRQANVRSLSTSKLKSPRTSESREEVNRCNVPNCISSKNQSSKCMHSVPNLMPKNRYSLSMPRTPDIQPISKFHQPIRQAYTPLQTSYSFTYPFQPDQNSSNFNQQQQQQQSQSMMFMNTNNAPYSTIFHQNVDGSGSFQYSLPIIQTNNNFQQIGVFQPSYNSQMPNSALNTFQANHPMLQTQIPTMNRNLTMSPFLPHMGMSNSMMVEGNNQHLGNSSSQFIKLSPQKPQFVRNTPLRNINTRTTRMASPPLRRACSDTELRDYNTLGMNFAYSAMNDEYTAAVMASDMNNKISSPSCNLNDQRGRSRASVSSIDSAKSNESSISTPRDELGSPERLKISNISEPSSEIQEMNRNENETASFQSNHMNLAETTLKVSETHETEHSNIRDSESTPDFLHLLNYMGSSTEQLSDVENINILQQDERNIDSQHSFTEPNQFNLKKYHETISQNNVTVVDSKYAQRGDVKLYQRGLRSDDVCGGTKCCQVVQTEDNKLFYPKEQYFIQSSTNDPNPGVIGSKPQFGGSIESSDNINMQNKIWVQNQHRLYAQPHVTNFPQSFQTNASFSNQIQTNLTHLEHHNRTVLGVPQCDVLMINPNNDFANSLLQQTSTDNHRPKMTSPTRPATDSYLISNAPPLNDSWNSNTDINAHFMRIGTDLSPNSYEKYLKNSNVFDSGPPPPN